MPPGVVLMCAESTLVVPAGHTRVERSEDAVRIFAVKPDVPVVMRLKVMCLVDGRGGIVDHGVVGNTVKRGRGVVISASFQASGEHKILHSNQFERAIGLRLSKARLPAEKIGMRAGAVDPGFGGLVMPSMSGRK